MFAKPQLPQRESRTVGADASEDGDDDDEGPIASINAMTIRVGGDDDDDDNTGPPLHAPSSTKPASASSLRSLLSIPPMTGPAPALRNGAGTAGSLLGVPPSTSAKTAPAGVGGASGARVGGSEGLGTLPSEIAPRRHKVILGPGCSALDWARLKSSIPSQGFRKIKPSELKLHKSTDDAWSAFHGKVYNLSPYLRFHPGGEKELMRVAGRDGTRLFSE